MNDLIYYVNRIQEKKTYTSDKQLTTGSKMDQAEIVLTAYSINTGSFQ